jgi:uncharacterized protein (DUF305 family)
MVRGMRRLLVAAVLLLAACGHQAGSGPRNDADVAFAQGMLAADDHATEVVELIRDHTGRPELNRLADRVDGSRGQEIARVQGWLGGWGKPVEPGAGLDPEVQLPAGVISDEQLDQLDQLRGERFDLAFVDAFTGHDRAVIELARRELRDGSLREVKDFAHQVVAGRQAEIDELAGWKHAWS